MSDQLVLNEDRFFDPEPSVRKYARELYHGVKDLPIVCPHGHTEPSWFSENTPFPDPTQLILIPDHYVFRMLYSQGIPLEDLGVPTIDGTAVEQDHRKIWQIFGDNFHLFAGTPTGIWLNHSFLHVFGVQDKLNSQSAMAIYDHIAAQLRKQEFLPRQLFDNFNIEVLTTTDAAESNLEHHRRIKEDTWQGKVVPCFRPDGVTDLSRADWARNVQALSQVAGIDITSYKAFINALERQREFFLTLGATSTDHGVLSPYTHELSKATAEEIFSRALSGKAGDEDAAAFTAHMLIESARMASEDGLVMQMHPGSFRNHNETVFRRFGPDKGCDIPTRSEYTRNLRELLNRFGNSRNFKLILFTLDETTYSRELAPLAGHYPALRLGPAWWFHDSLEGMSRFRRQTTETAGIYNTVGFNDDTRAFPSIPARHDLSRRVDCNYLAGLVARHVIDMADARRMSRALAYDLAKEAYNLN